MIPLIYLVGCAGVFWSAFCRLRHTNATTRWPVRIACIGAATAGAWGCFAAIFWGQTVEAVDAGLALAFFGMQWMSAVQWRKGVPPEYVESVPS